MVAGTAADAEAEEGWPKPNPVVVDGPSAGADDAEEVVAPEPKPKTFPEEDEEEEEGGGGGGGGGDDEDDEVRAIIYLHFRAKSKKRTCKMLEGLSIDITPPHLRPLP